MASASFTNSPHGVDQDHIKKLGGNTSLGGLLPWVRLFSSDTETSNERSDSASSSLLCSSGTPSHISDGSRKVEQVATSRFTKQEEKFPRFILMEPIRRPTKEMPDRYPRFVQTSYFYDRILADSALVQASEEEMTNNPPNDRTDGFLCARGCTDCEEFEGRYQSDMPSIGV